MTRALTLPSSALLGLDRETKTPIVLPDGTLHTYIIGNTGMGKTSLERLLINHTITAGHGVCVLDPHGERQGSLVDCVLSDLPSDREQDVILFDINEPRLVPGLKPFYCRDPSDPIAVQDTISTALNIFEKVYNVDRNTMARIIAYIESLIYLFIFHPDLTLLDIPQLLNPDSKYDRKRLEATTHLPPSPGYNFTREFWTEEYSRRAKRGYNQDSEIFGTLMKFRELSSHLLYPMFCQQTNTLDIREIMRERKILLVKLSGNWEDVTSLLGTYLIGQIKDAAFHRSVSDPPFYLYCDEFQKFSSRDFLTLFSESRGGNLHVTIDHQVVSQLDDTMKETVRQADAFFCFRITDISADQIGGMFDCSPRPGGVPRFEPLMTPVKEPIQYMLTHGVHPVDSVREFIDQYGNLLVEGERLEEEAARRSQSISDRLTYSTSTWHVMPPPPPAYPEFNCQIALHMLNSLFYQAMLYGKQGKDVRSIPIDPLAIDYFIIATYSPGTTYLFHRNAYRRAYPGVRNFAQRQQELTDNLAYLPGYRYSSLYPYYHKKRLAHRILSLREKRTRDFYEISSAITGAWRANQELQRAIARVDGIIQQKTEALEQELALLTQIAQAAPEYETSCQELTETIQTVMQELAKAPVQAASGLLQEIPTELPTPEVEARIANQLKLLPQFSARCRIGNTEYTITTPVPPSVLPAAELTQRIQRIQQHNVTDGYLRHRSEVEQELILPSASQLQGNGHTGVQQGIATPPLPQSRRKK